MINHLEHFERIQKIKSHLALYFVAGTVNSSSPLPFVLKQAIAGGITIFQFREKGEGALEDRAKEEMARHLLTLCREHRIPFIVNDDVELAVRIGADGVHIGQEDGDASAIRKRIGHTMWLGVSAHDVEEAQAAVEAGADYLGVGPMYETSTKTDTRPVQGPRVIQQIRQTLPNVPIVGIGGIHQGNLGPVIEAGADGIAVVSAISQSADPLAATQVLKSEIEAVKNNCK